MSKIPFKWLPASWGLKGKSYDLAEANYYHIGKELDYKLLEIEKKHGLSEKEYDTKFNNLQHQYGLISDYDYALTNVKIHNNGEIPAEDRLSLEFEHNKIDAYEYDKSLVFLEFPDTDTVKHKVSILAVDFKHGKIEKNKFEKTVATLKEEPWIDIVDHGFDPKQGVNGVYFEFDWNEYWVDFLRKNGYHGFNDEQIVEQWFSDVCRTQVDGTPVENDTIPFNSSRAITRQYPNDDGSTGYS